MNKLILSLAAVVMAFTSVAGAKPKSSNTEIAKAAPPERGYSSYNNDSFFMGSGNTHEFTTFLTRAAFVSEKRSKNASAGTSFDIGASYLYTLNGGVQAGGEGRLQILSKEYSPTGNSKTLIDLLGVAAYNFQSDLKNAFFLKAGLGIYSVLNNTESDYENKLGLFFGGGKRFALWNNVSYTPEARFVKKGDIDLGFQIAFLNFSVIW